jgi:hypothetical protein
VILAVTLSQAGAGLVVAIPSLILAYFGYKKSQKIDNLAERAGIAKESSITTGQVLESLDAIILRISEDNAQLRIQVTALRERLDGQDALIAALRSEVASLLRRNGSRGADFSSSSESME